MQFWRICSTLVRSRADACAGTQLLRSYPSNSFADDLENSKPEPELKSPVSSHNEWDPLEEVIVGRVEGKKFIFVYERKCVRLWKSKPLIGQEKLIHCSYCPRPSLLLFVLLVAGTKFKTHRITRLPPLCVLMPLLAQNKFINVTLFLNKSIYCLDQELAFFVTWVVWNLLLVTTRKYSFNTADITSVPWKYTFILTDIHFRSLQIH